MEFFSYIDPGTGSVIAQALIGVAVGAGVLIKTYWSKIKAMFGGKSNETSKDLRSGKNDKNA
jgi:hypothetical protein